MFPAFDRRLGACGAHPSSVRSAAACRLGVGTAARARGHAYAVDAQGAHLHDAGERLHRIRTSRFHRDEAAGIAYFRMGASAVAGLLASAVGRGMARSLETRDRSASMGEDGARRGQAFLGKSLSSTSPIIT